MTGNTRRPRLSPAIIVSLASLVAAAAGYGVLVIAAGYLGSAGYAEFSLLWAALYVLVGMLFGLQQETTRSVRESSSLDTKKGPTLLNAGLLSGALLGVLMLVLSPLWAPVLRSSNVVLAVAAIALGVLLYSGHAVLSGGLSGRHGWNVYSLLLMSEAVLRLAAVTIAAVAALGVVGIGFASAIPMGTWILFYLLSPKMRQIARLRTGASLWRTLGQHWQSMSASLASALLVTGFPLILSVGARGSTLSEMGAVILVTLLTRAPIMVPLNALMSMLVGAFVDRRHNRWPLVGKLVASILGGSLLLGALAAWAGGWAIEFFFGADFIVSAWFLGFSVVNAGLMGILTVLGAAVLASGRHTIYAAGWLIAAAIAMIALLVLPLPLELRVSVALSVGPLVGVMIQLVGLMRAQPLARPAQ